MFFDDKPQGEVTEAPARTLKFSDAIRRGHHMIKEASNTLAYCAGCAMGAALVAEGLEPKDGWAMNSDAQKRLATHFKIPQKVVQRVSQMHFNGDMKRLELADWLEAQGY